MTWGRVLFLSERLRTWLRGYSHHDQHCWFDQVSNTIDQRILCVYCGTRFPDVTLGRLWHAAHAEYGKDIVPKLSACFGSGSFSKDWRKWTCWEITSLPASHYLGELARKTQTYDAFRDDFVMPLILADSTQFVYLRDQLRIVKSQEGLFENETPCIYARVLERNLALQQSVVGEALEG